MSSLRCLHACGPLFYSVESSDCSTGVERKGGIGNETKGGARTEASLPLLTLLVRRRLFGGLFRSG